MHEFLITVACVFHLNCMIPGGVRIIRPFYSLQSCEAQAQAFIGQIGGNPSDYYVTCRRK